MDSLNRTAAPFEIQRRIRPTDAWVGVGNHSSEGVAVANAELIHEFNRRLGGCTRVVQHAADGSPVNVVWLLESADYAARARALERAGKGAAA